MKVTTAEIAALGMVTTVLAAWIAPVVARREGKRTRRYEWALRAGDAYGQARRAWSLCGPDQVVHGAGIAAGLGLIPMAEFAAKEAQISAAVDALHSVAATSEHPKVSDFPDEIARRLWLLQAAMIASYNVIKNSAPTTQRQALQPLQEQLEKATGGWKDAEGVEALSLEELFDHYKGAIRRAAST